MPSILYPVIYRLFSKQPMCATLYIMKEDDYIIVTGSHNLSDDKQDEGDTQQESDVASQHTLEEQGIFLDQQENETARPELQDEFSKKLQEISGIEILPNEDENISSGE